MSKPRDLRKPFPPSMYQYIGKIATGLFYRYVRKIRLQIFCRIVTGCGLILGVGRAYYGLKRYCNLSDSSLNNKPIYYITCGLFYQYNGKIKPQ